MSYPILPKGTSELSALISGLQSASAHTAVRFTEDATNEQGVTECHFKVHLKLDIVTKAGIFSSTQSVQRIKLLLVEQSEVEDEQETLLLLVLSADTLEKIKLI